MIHKTKQNGYILLFSIIITSILLALVGGIIYASYRQAYFTKEVKQSTKAFYAADTALDCLIPMDNRGDFGGSSNTIPVVGPETLCVEEPVIRPLVQDNKFIYDAEYSKKGSSTLIPIGKNLCARAHVTKFGISTGTTLISTNDAEAAEIPQLAVDGDPKIDGTKEQSGLGKGNIFENKIDVWGYNLSCEELLTHLSLTELGEPSPYEQKIVERSLNYTYYIEE